MKDYYKILEVDKAASGGEIKKAYRKKAKEIHPDKKDSGKTIDEMKELNEAYNVLKDDFAKNQYDLKYPFFFEKENTVFYDSINTDTHPRSLYDEWKEDNRYKKLMVYLWLIFGVVVALVIFLIFAFDSLNAGNPQTVPKPKDKVPENLNPKEIHEEIPPEENIKEI